MGNYSINIDRRHVELVADIMTMRGTVLGAPASHHSPTFFKTVTTNSPRGCT
jgi:hypothetical protein